MSLLKCEKAFQMPSNINSDIKNKIWKKKYISDRTTLIFSAYDSKHTFFGGLKAITERWACQRIESALFVVDNEQVYLHEA